MCIYKISTYVYFLLYVLSKREYAYFKNNSWNKKLASEERWIKYKIEEIIKFLVLCILIGSEFPGNHGNKGNKTSCVVYIIPHRRECF